MMHLIPSNVPAFRAVKTAAIGPLMDRLSDTDADVRAAAAWALGNFGDPRAESALLKLFADKAKASRVFGQDSSGHFDGPFRNHLDWTDKLAKTVGHHAMIASGRIAGDRGVEALRAAASDDDPHVRLIALAVFDRVGGDRAIAIAARALHDDESDVRSAAIRIFRRASGTIVSRGTFRTVLAAAGAKSPAVRAAGVWALAAFDHPEALATISAARNDPDETVRKEAAAALTLRRDLPPKSMLRVSPE